MASPYSTTYNDNMSETKKNDFEMLESPSAKEVEVHEPRMVNGVIPVGQIDMTEDEKRIVRSDNALAASYGVRTDFRPHHPVARGHKLENGSFLASGPVLSLPYEWPRPIQYRKCCSEYYSRAVKTFDLDSNQTVGFAQDVHMPATAVNNSVTLFFITCMYTITSLFAQPK
jgi:hypothetical protein